MRWWSRVHVTPLVGHYRQIFWSGDYRSLDESGGVKLTGATAPLKIPHGAAAMVQQKTANAFAGDSLKDLVQGVLLSLEGLIPDRRSTRVIDDFENPSSLMLSAIDHDLDGSPITGDLLAERGVDDLEFVVHAGPPGAW
jgi:hypothetical protein